MVLGVARGVLFPDRGSSSGPLIWEQSLSLWTTREVLESCHFIDTLNSNTHVTEGFFFPLCWNVLPLKSPFTIPKDYLGSYVAYVCDMLGHECWLLPFLLTLVAGGTLRDSEAEMVSSSLLCCCSASLSQQRQGVQFMPPNVERVMSPGKSGLVEMVNHRR